MRLITTAFIFSLTESRQPKTFRIFACVQSPWWRGSNADDHVTISRAFLCHMGHTAPRRLSGSCDKTERLINEWKITVAITNTESWLLSKGLIITTFNQNRFFFPAAVDTKSEAVKCGDVRMLNGLQCVSTQRHTWRVCKYWCNLVLSLHHLIDPNRRKDNTTPPRSLPPPPSPWLPQAHVNTPLFCLYLLLPGSPSI